MSDIFDDLDSIFVEGTSSDEEIANFNDAELHEIMSEIDDLEKEFEAEAKPEVEDKEKDKSEEAPMSLQEKIDAELSIELPVQEEKIPEEKQEALQAKSEVLAFEKMAPSASPKEVSSSSGVSFQAQGHMSLNLDFKVGHETAKLVIDPVKGLVVTLTGVELCISEDSGCTVSMDNGMKFTIPLSTQENSLKKKSA